MWDGVMTTCNVLSEGGDTSLIALADLDTVASEYFVVYVTEDSPNTGYGPLKRGYNLVWMSSNDGWLQSEKCQLDTFEAALAEYNEEHGTSHTRDSDEPALDALGAAAWKECSWLKVIEDPLHVDLVLELGGVSPLRN